MGIGKGWRRNKIRAGSSVFKWRRKSMSIGPKAKISRGGESGERFLSGLQADSNMPTAGTSADEHAPSAAEVCDLAAQVKRRPDVRLQKVAALRNALDAGNYQVSSEQVADAMISAHEPWAGV